MNSTAHDLYVYTLKDREQKIRQGIAEDSIISLTDSILLKAIRKGASDIHFEPTRGVMRVRFRIDGLLYDQEPLDSSVCFSVLSRLKVLASLDIAQRLLPQDGKLRVELLLSDREHQIDFRIATFPSIYGEKMVVRILDRERNCIELSNLGFNSYVSQGIESLIQQPHGFFLVTGPTGCGKTTTLYAILAKLNRGMENIVTMEDPVEYSLDGIVQSQVNLKAGFNFENGLRHILRQDPDIVMIGEIRDKATVRIAMEAALTGHLVLSTLHTNDATSAIVRLIEMGIERFLLNGSLSGVLAQRLVRKLCEFCKEKRKLSEDECKMLRLHGYDIGFVYKASGCSSCFELGHKGRMAIAELLMLNEEIKELILAKASVSEIKNFAIKQGMKTLKDDLTEKLSEGVISLEEFSRMID